MIRPLANLREEVVMRKGGGKQKGAAFEREVCKKLSLWVSNGKQEDVFWRSAMSGGRSTVAHAKGKRLTAQAGDISCIHPIGEVFASRYFIECKHYANLNYLGLLTGTGHLVEFWKEAKEQSRIYNKQPILIAKQNRQPTMFCLGLEGSVYLEIPSKLLVLSAPLIDFYAFEFESVLKNVIPTGRRPTPN